MKIMLFEGIRLCELKYNNLAVYLFDFDLPWRHFSIVKERDHPINMQNE